MPDSDVTLTFDPVPFENGVKRANRSVNKLTGNLDDMGNTSDVQMGRMRKQQKGLTMGFGKMAAVSAIGGAVAGVAMAGVQAALAGARKVLGAFLKELPEVQQTFNIMRQIFMRNFLFPIRKAMMPFLQRMLDWVRDHRTLFVKWGQIVVSIFKTIVGWVRRAVDWFRRMSQALITFVNRTFGLQIQKMGDLFNILQFKLVAIFQFIGQAISPIFEKMLEVAGEVGRFLIEPLRAFFEGFGGQLGGITDDFKDLWESIKQVFVALRDLDERTGVFTTTLKVLGTLLGGALRLSLLTALSVIRGIAFQVSKIPMLIDIIAVKSKRESKRTEQDVARLQLAQIELQRVAEEEKAFMADVGRRMVDAAKKSGQAIIEAVEENPLMMERRARQRGEGPGFEDVRAQLEALPPDERRRVLLKLEEKGHDISQFGFNIENINVTVTEGNAEQAGRNFVEGMRDEYNRDFLGQGQ